MATLRWTRESTFADNRRNVTARGQGVYEVPDEVVEEYLDHPSGGWEQVDADAEDEDVEDATADGTEDDDFDAEAFVDRTPMSEVVEDIEAGEADGHLDEVEAAAERQGVREAVADRLEELREVDREAEAETEAETENDADAAADADTDAENEDGED